MDSIRQDLNDLDNRILTNKSFDYEFKINGPLTNYPVNMRSRLDGALVARAQTFTRARLFLENPGTSGDLEVDIRKYKKPNTPIIQIVPQYSQGINNIAQVAPNIATQSISLATATVATQSITAWKAAINISSILPLGFNLVRYNLATLPDSEWKTGDSVNFSGATSAANNGSFTIVRINDDGVGNIVVTNPAGVAQTGVAGTATLAAWSYNYINPLSSNFVAGESVVFAAHTSAVNNGTFSIYAVNSGGNNLVIKNPTGVAQAGVAGTAQTTRWVYSYLAPVSTTDFVVGELARMAAHTNALNNGDFTIRAVNASGNNLVVSNNVGVAQGGVAGTANTTRWIYALPTDPTTQISAGDTIHPTGTTNPVNSGYFVVKQVNRLGTNNVVVSNSTGVAQAGAAGLLDHTRTLFKFSADQSAVFSTASKAEILGCTDAIDGIYDVLQVNRGGGANFNIVCSLTKNATNVAQSQQASPAGRVILESKSIFTVRPKLSLPTSVTNSTNRHLQVDERSAGDFNAEATVASGDILCCDLTLVPNGAPSDVTIQLV